MLVICIQYAPSQSVVSWHAEVNSRINSRAVGLSVVVLLPKLLCYDVAHVDAPPMMMMLVGLVCRNFFLWCWDRVQWLTYILCWSGSMSECVCETYLCNKMFMNINMQQTLTRTKTYVCESNKLRDKILWTGTCKVRKQFHSIRKHTHLHRKLYMYLRTLFCDIWSAMCIGW